MEFDGDRPVRVDTVVISSQHDPDVPMEPLREDIIREVVRADHSRRTCWMSRPGIIHQSYRPFCSGRPSGGQRPDRAQNHCGYLRWVWPPWRRRLLRKGSHEGGSFGGIRGPLGGEKHCGGGIGDRRCEVQLAYAIGVAHPVSIMVESFGTGAVSDEILAKAVERVFDLRPAAIIQTMGLRRPILPAVGCARPYGPGRSRRGVGKNGSNG